MSPKAKEILFALGCALGAVAILAGIAVLVAILLQ